MTTFIDINITDSTGAFNVGELEAPERKINQPLVKLGRLIQTDEDGLVQAQDCGCARCRAMKGNV